MTSVVAETSSSCPTTATASATIATGPDFSDLGPEPDLILLEPSDVEEATAKVETATSSERDKGDVIHHKRSRDRRQQRLQ